MREAPNWFRLKRELWWQCAVNQRCKVCLKQPDCLCSVVSRALDKRGFHSRAIADDDEKLAVLVALGK